MEPVFRRIGQEPESVEVPRLHLRGGLHFDPDDAASRVVEHQIDLHFILRSEVMQGGPGRHGLVAVNAKASK